MEVVEVRGNLISLRNIGIIPVLRTGDGIGLADTLGLFQGLVGPDAGIEIGGLLLEVVHRNIEELEGGAAAEEDDFVGIRDIEKFPPEGTALVHCFIPFLSAVGN